MINIIDAFLAWLPMVEFNYIIKIDNGSILYILYDNKSEWINIIW